MIILQTAPCEVASPENKLRVFNTLEDAQAEMRRQIVEMAHESGYQMVFETDEPKDDWDEPYIDHIEERYAFSIDSCAWIIHEVPGTFVKQEEV